MNKILLDVTSLDTLLSSYKERRKELRCVDLCRDCILFHSRLNQSFCQEERPMHILLFLEEYLDKWEAT